MRHEPDSLLHAPAADEISEYGAANPPARTDGPFMVGLPCPPPQPVADCAECEELAARREAVRTGRDHNAEVDTNATLRRHQREAHPHGRKAAIAAEGRSNRP